MLTFEELQQINQKRCEEVFHPVDEWSETDWATAFGGEAGEALNMIKKRRRQTTSAMSYLREAPTVEEVIDELADTVIYADLLATRLGGKLEDGIRRKFNEVSMRTGSKLTI